MSRRQRILLVVVAGAILLLYLAAVATQSRNDQEGREAGTGGPVGLLGDWFGDVAGADPGDIDAECRTGEGRLVFDGSCTVAVAPSGRALRLVTLRTGGAMEVSAPAPAGDFTVETELAAGDTVRVAVGADGAEIALDCVDPEECVVTIGAEDG